jgi:hypothetical protein
VRARDAMDRQYGVLRQADGLFALICRQADCIAELSYAKPELPEGSVFKLIQVPLSPDSASNKLLLQSWERLKKVQRVDLAATLDVLLIVSQTVFCPQDEALTKRVSKEQEQVLPVPTAAHPRAYKGTKFKPAKVARPKALDLTSILCNRAALNEFLAGEANEFIDEAKCKLGLNAQNLALIDASVWDGDSLYVQVNHGGVLKGDELPWEFTRSLLPAMAGRPIAELTGALSYFWKLRLDVDTELLSVVVLLAVLAPGNLPKVLELLCAESRDTRALLAALLVRSALVQSSEIAKLTPLLLAKVQSSSSSEIYPHYLARVIEAVANGSSVEYIELGFELMEKFHPNRSIDKIFGQHPPKIASLCEYIQASKYYRESEDKRLPLELWRQCGKLPGLNRIINETEWKRLDPASADVYLNMFRYFYDYDENAPVCTETYEYMLANSRRLFDRLVAVPAAKRQHWMRIADRSFYFWDKEPENLARHYWCSLDIADQLVAVPYSVQPETIKFFNYLLENVQLRDFAVSMSNQTLKQIAEFARRDNQRWLLICGIKCMINVSTELVKQGLAHYATKFVRVTRLIATVPKDKRQQVVEEYKASFLNEQNFSLLSPEQIYRTFVGKSYAEFDNPLTRKLRDHFEGSKILSGVQMERCIVEFLERVWLSRLQLLEALLKSALGKSRSLQVADDKKLLHALQLLYRSTPENNRAFKRFLAAYLDGESDYLIRHPLTVAWLKRHPKINVDVLISGVKLEGVCGGVAVSLELEKDPLESLMMGTYIGSCLGLGGDFAFSAFANVLDVNKQVIYARDKSGTVIARQLVSISESDELVCYTVYPGTCGAALESLFEQYDQEFAKALNVEIFKYDDSDLDKTYKVELIIANDWFDDCSLF